MSTELAVRESRPGETAEIEALYPQAFPDEDLLPLVRSLLADPNVAVSLVAMIDTRIVGHAIFTMCGVTGCEVKAALLGPVAVAPARQRQGIGSSMLRAGLRRMKDTGVSRVFVLGDPGYYGRLGFATESRVEPPYPLPGEWQGAWQSQALGETSTACRGTLAVPRQWRQAGLWAP